MRKSTAVAAAACMVLVALATAGCTTWFESPAKPANDAIAVANTHLKQASTLESQVASGGAALQVVPYTKAGAKNALKITAAVTASLTSEREELLAAKAAMDGIAKLDVTATFKQYAKLEAAAIEARIALVDADSRLYAGMDRLYSALTTASNTVDKTDLTTAIQQMQAEVSALTDSASAAAKAASDYFTANKLGG
jgi:hypothetical protein